MYNKVIYIKVIFISYSSSTLIYLKNFKNHTSFLISYNITSYNAYHSFLNRVNGLVLWWKHWTSISHLSCINEINLNSSY